MSTTLPREEAVEAIFSKILASPEASERLSGVFYDHIDDDHRLTDADEELLSGEKTTHIPEIFDIN